MEKKIEFRNVKPLNPRNLAIKFLNFGLKLLLYCTNLIIVCELTPPPPPRFTICKPRPQMNYETRKKSQLLSARDGINIKICNLPSASYRKFFFFLNDGVTINFIECPFNISFSFICGDEYLLFSGRPHKQFFSRKIKYYLS